MSFLTDCLCYRSHHSTVVGVPLWAHRHQRLTEAVIAQRYEFGGGEAEEDGSVTIVELPVEKSGECHAIALWVDVALDEAGDEVEHGSPDSVRPYQRQGLRFLEKPRTLDSAHGGESGGLRVIVRRAGGGTRLELEVLE